MSVNSSAPLRAQMPCQKLGFLANRSIKYTGSMEDRYKITAAQQETVSCQKLDIMKMISIAIVPELINLLNQ